MKRYARHLFIALFLSLLVLRYARAMASSSPAYFSGEIRGLSLKATDSLNILFWKDYICEADPGEALDLHVKIDKQGKFHFILPRFEQPGRMDIMFRYNTGLIKVIVEPGDSIHIHLTMSDQDLVPNVTGKGAIKYNLCYQIRPEITIMGQGDPMENLDSIFVDINRKTLLIETYSESMDRFIFNILKADAAGYAYCRLYDCIYYSDSAHRERWKNISDEFIGAFTLLPDKESIGFYSPAYIQFLATRARVRLNLNQGKDKVTLKNVYDQIRQTLNGSVREKVLAYLLLNRFDTHSYFSGCDADEYAACFNDCIALVKTPDILRRLLAEKEIAVKGSVMDNFALPDSSGKLVHLKDFAGKVVLVDLWGFHCSGCLIFEHYFKKEVYPAFADNPDFVVISVADEWKRNLWLDAISKYSDQRFVNLIVGNPKNNSLYKYYAYHGLPTVLLIGKDGKLISSTLPGEKKEEFIRVIAKALSEPL